MTQFFFLGILSSFLLNSCVLPDPSILTNEFARFSSELDSDDRDEENDRSMRDRKKDDDDDEPRRRKQCDDLVSSSDQVCEDNKECEEVCDDIFSSSKEEKKCLELSTRVVYELEYILEIVEDGEAEDIDEEHLKCLLSLDDKEFAERVQDLNAGKSRKFLNDILEHDEVGAIIADEDSAYNILEGLIDNLGDDDDKFFKKYSQEIFESGNDDIITWFASYIQEMICDSGSDCDYNDDQIYDANGTGDEDIQVYFCKAFLNLDEDEIDDIIGDEYFEDLFDDMEDYNCYDINPVLKDGTTTFPDDDAEKIHNCSIDGDDFEQFCAMYYDVAPSDVL